MRVALIEPSYGFAGAQAWIPIGKLYLAAVLRDNGFDVRILDCALAKGESVAEDFLRRFAPDVVGIGGMTLQMSSTSSLARLARRVCPPEVLLVGGGVHLTIMPQDGIGLFDVVVLGEGEQTFLEVCQKFRKMDRRKEMHAFEEIQGLYYVTGDGGASATSPRPFIEDLDRLPLPAYDLVDLNAYGDFLKSGEKAVSVMTSRGCPFDCDFCASPTLSRRRVRYFSLDYTFRMIDDLCQRTGLRNLRIMDDAFTLSPSRTRQFCKRVIERNRPYRMTCLTHVRATKPEVLRALKDAGFTIVALGIESGSNQVLQLVNKKITREQAAQSVADARQAGLSVEGLYMIGNIGETRETIAETIGFAREHNPPYVAGKSERTGYNWFQFATPFPGSRFFSRAREYGEVVSTDWDHYSHQEPVFVPRGLTAKEMIALRKRALKVCNARPSAIRRLIRRLGSVW